MRIQDQVERAVSTRLGDTEPPEDAWEAIERGVTRAARRSRVWAMVAAGLILTLFAGVAGGLWVLVRPAPRRLPVPGETPPPTTMIAPRVAGTVDLSGRGHVAALVVADGSVWAATSGAEGGPPEVVRAGPEDAAFTTEVRVAGAPGWELGGDGMAAAPGGIWITSGDWDTEQGAVLERIDPSEGRVTATVPLGGRFGADVAADATGVWASVFGAGTSVQVIRVDPTTNRVAATIPIEGDWIREVFATEGHVLVRSMRGDERYLTVIDRTTDEVVVSRSVDVEGPFAAWDGWIWAGTDSGRALVRIDPRTAEAVGDPLPLGGTTLANVALAPGEGGLWFIGYPLDAEQPEPMLHRFNPETGAVDVSVGAPDDAIAIAVGLGSVWILDYEGMITQVELYPGP